MSGYGRVLSALEQEILDGGLARRPTTGPGGDGDLPPIWHEPRGGAVGPGDRGRDNKTGVQVDSQADPGVVLSLFYTGGFTEEPHVTTWERHTFDLWYRARVAEHAFDLAHHVWMLLHDRRNVVLGVGDPGRALRVVEVLEWRKLQPVPPRAGGEGGGRAWVQSWLVQSYATGFPERD